MKNSNGIFWTSTSFNTTQARFRELLHYTAQINHSAWNKDFGISVRCVKGYYTPNQPPEVPSNPNPPIGSVYANNYLHVAWSCSDPDGDPLTYDLYFGSESNPPLAIADIADTTYWSLYNLPYNNIYYWKVVARDIHGNTTEGPLWYFVTENFPWYCGDPLIDERDGKI
nr:hypothetical protein [Bacteroidota bacterium]